MASERLSIAVATNFVPVMRTLATDYQAKNEIDVRITTGSTGKLVAQLLLGAPHDLFFSADQERVVTLIEAKVADVSSRCTYAIGRLVYWAPSYDLEGHSFKEALARSNPAIVALANAKLAPYGEASQRVLTKVLDKKSTQPRLVTAENIGQVYAYVASSNVDAGFVAFSAVKGNRDIDPRSYVVVPSILHQSIRQDAVLLRRSKIPSQALAFLKYVRSEDGQQIIAQYGYDLP